MRYLNVGDLVKEKNLHSGWDETHQSFALDQSNEDQVGPPGTAGCIWRPSCMEIYAMRCEDEPVAAGAVALSGVSAGAG